MTQMCVAVKWHIDQLSPPAFSRLYLRLFLLSGGVTEAAGRATTAEGRRRWRRRRRCAGWLWP